MPNIHRHNQMLYSIMLDYMEQHGDLSKYGPGTEARLDNLQHWVQLTELLNNKIGESRPSAKWRKCWSDFKNNVNRKASKLRKHPGLNRKLTDTEMRLIELMKKQGSEKKSTEDDNELFIEEETTLDDEERSVSSLAQYFCSDNDPTTNRRISRQSSFASEASSSQHSTGKTNKHSKDMKVSDRYLEFEREKEQMAHEREMARIKQNNDIINIFGRMVSVLESLSPSIRQYLNGNNNEGKNT